MRDIDLSQPPGCTAVGTSVLACNRKLKRPSANECNILTVQHKQLASMRLEPPMPISDAGSSSHELPECTLVSCFRVAYRTGDMPRRRASVPSQRIYRYPEKLKTLDERFRIREAASTLTTAYINGLLGVP